MWNTLFEFRATVYEELLEKCQDAGFGIIEGLEPFKDTLFVTGCGYSFYGAHWIPLYLSLFPKEAKKYKDVNYSMM